MGSNSERFGLDRRINVRVHNLFYDEFLTPLIEELVEEQNGKWSESTAIRHILYRGYIEVRSGEFPKADPLYLIYPEKYNQYRCPECGCEDGVILHYNERSDEEVAEIDGLEPPIPDEKLKRIYCMACGTEAPTFEFMVK